MITGGSGAQWSRTRSGDRNTWHWWLLLLFTLWFPLNETVNLSEPLSPHLWNSMIILQFHLGPIFKEEQHTRTVKSKTLASTPKFHTFQSWLTGSFAIHLWIRGKHFFTKFHCPRKRPKSALWHKAHHTAVLFLDLKIAFKCSYSFKRSTLLIALPE